VERAGDAVALDGAQAQGRAQVRTAIFLRHDFARCVAPEDKVHSQSPCGPWLLAYLDAFGNRIPDVFRKAHDRILPCREQVGCVDTTCYR